MYQFTFEKLEVWKLARGFANLIYTLSDKFPESEKYNLESQIKRAAVSVMNNIAEGTGRKSLKEQARFSEMAYASLMEVMTCAILAEDRGFIKPKDINAIRKHVSLLSTKLNRYRESQLRRAEERGLKR